MSKPQLIRRVLADPRLEIYACGREDIRTGQIDRRVLAAARVPGRARLPAHGHLAQVRPLRLHLLRQRQPPLLRATPSTSPRSTASRCSATRARARSPRRWSRDVMAAPGHDGARPDHLADGLRRRQHLRDGRPRRPRPRRLPAAVGPGAGSVSQQFTQILKPDQWRAPDRPDRRDRQPGGADLALALRAPARAGHDEKAEDRPTSAAALRAPTSASNRPSAASNSVRRRERPGRSPLRPARARRHRRARGRPLPRAATPSGCSSSDVAGAPPPPRRRLGRAKPKDADPERRAADRAADDPDRDPARPLGDERRRRALARRAARRPRRAGRGGAPTALVLVNRAVHAHRAAVLDPDARRRRRRRMRWRCGSASATARSSPTAASRGRSRCRARRAAAAARCCARRSGSPGCSAAASTVAACELLVLRARADLDAGRGREAALQLRVGLEALLAEREALRAPGQDAGPRRARRAPRDHRRGGERGARRRARRRARGRGHRDAAALRARAAPPAGVGVRSGAPLGRLRRRDAGPGQVGEAGAARRVRGITGWRVEHAYGA